jgi:hypothetical protein
VLTAVAASPGVPDCADEGVSGPHRIWLSKPGLVKGRGRYWRFGPHTCDFWARTTPKCRRARTNGHDLLKRERCLCRGRLALGYDIPSQGR